MMAEISRDHSHRQRWMSVLAKADAAAVAALWQQMDPPAYGLLRRPEVGMVMVRGRAGGDGAAFNLGEMTVTRCSIRLEDTGAVGHAWVAGRDLHHAEQAAVFDALLQDDSRRSYLEARVIAPLEAALAAKRAAATTKTAATKVEFFTMVRGDT